MKSHITPIVSAVIAGDKTAQAYVEEAFTLLDEKNPVYNVTVSDVRERALQRAVEVDAAVKNGEPIGRLAGVPFIAKDNFLAFGSDTTASSNMLKGFHAPYQATAIELLEKEGAICIAKANLDAFAHGSSTENSDFGPTKNAVDAERVPGGSSGGSATAVALDIVPFALGTDTGGSIRLPASYSGVVGFKPTYGTVSRYGVVAMASSTDVIGPLAKTAYDAALITDILAGKDDKDGTTLPDRSESYLPENPAPLKIGLVKEYMTDDVDSDVRASVTHTADELRRLGHTVEEVSLPSLPLALAVYYIVVPAEISSNLARYDGIKYGHSSKDATSLEGVYGKSRDEGFNAENKRRILIGNYVLSSGYYDAYYRKAQTVRTKLIHEFNQTFEHYDILLGPVAPTPPFKIGQNTGDPLQMYLEDIMTVAVSLAGLPAISTPSLTANNLPVGAQLIGRQKADRLLLSVAAQLEEAK